MLPSSGYIRLPSRKILQVKTAVLFRYHLCTRKVIETPLDWEMWIKRDEKTWKMAKASDRGLFQDRFNFSIEFKSSSEHVWFIDQLNFCMYNSWAYRKNILSFKTLILEYFIMKNNGTGVFNQCVFFVWLFRGALMSPHKYFWLNQASSFSPRWRSNFQRDPSLAFMRRHCYIRPLQPVSAGDRNIILCVSKGIRSSLPMF